MSSAQVLSVAQHSHNNSSNGSDTKSSIAERSRHLTASILHTKKQRQPARITHSEWQHGALHLDPLALELMCTLVVQCWLTCQVMQAC